jgi:hypothetical protein
MEDVKLLVVARKVATSLSNCRLPLLVLQTAKMQDLVWDCNVMVYFIVCGRWLLSEQKWLIRSYKKYSQGNTKGIKFYEREFNMSNFYVLQRDITVTWTTTMMKCVGVNEK